MFETKIANGMKVAELRELLEARGKENVGKKEENKKDEGEGPPRKKTKGEGVSMYADIKARNDLHMFRYNGEHAQVTHKAVGSREAGLRIIEQLYQAMAEQSKAKHEVEDMRLKIPPGETGGGTNLARAGQFKVVPRTRWLLTSFPRRSGVW